MFLKLTAASLFTSGFLLISSSSLASQRVGNGGFVAICHDEPTSPIKGNHVLDYLDGEFRFPTLGKVDLGPAASPEEMARFVFKRLARVDAVRADKYLAELDKFFDVGNLKMLPEHYVLPAAGDTGDTTLPDNCKLEQAVANTIPSQPEEPKFWISQPIWDQLADSEKAGLIIHEIVYNDALIRGHYTSERARYFTFLISSQKISTIDQKAYDAVILRNELNEYTWFKESKIKLRYFDQLKLNYFDAVKFCDSLPGISGFPSYHLYDSYFLSSPIGKQIINLSPLGRDDIWTLSSRPDTDDNTTPISEDYNPSINNANIHSDPKSLQSVICQVDPTSI